MGNCCSYRYQKIMRSMHDAVEAPVRSSMYSSDVQISSGKDSLKPMKVTANNYVIDAGGKLGQISMSDVLKKSPLFSHLKKADLEQVSRLFTKENVKKGAVIYKARSIADMFYIVALGRVQLQAFTDDQVSYSTETKTEGNYFGELGLKYEDHFHESDAVAKTDSVLLKLPKKTYDYMSKAPYLKKLKAAVDTSLDVMRDAALKSIDLLNGVDETTTNLVLRMFHYRHVEPGERLMTEGEIGHTFYLISKGRAVATMKDSVTNLPIELAMLIRGDAFGEKSLLEEKRLATATVTAVEPTSVYYVNRQNFLNFLDLVPHLRNQMMQNLRDTNAVENLMEKVPFLRSIMSNKLHLMTKLCETKRYTKNQLVIKKGSFAAKGFYIITGGKADVVIEDKVVATLEVGAYFGEVSLIAAKAHTATVRAHSNDAEDLVVMYCDKRTFEQLFADEPTFYSELQIKLLGKDCELIHVLHHPVGKRIFLEFCEGDYSIENVEFWCEIEEFVRISNIKMRRSIARLLYDNLETKKDFVSERDGLMKRKANMLFTHYINNSAVRQINIKSKIFTKLQKEWKAGLIYSDMFNEAQEEVYKLMESDIFKRFTKSEKFTQMINEIGTYSNMKEKKSVNKNVTERGKEVLLPVAKGNRSSNRSSASKRSSKHSLTDSLRGIQPPPIDLIDPTLIIDPDDDILPPPYDPDADLIDLPPPSIELDSLIVEDPIDPLSPPKFGFAEEFGVEVDPADDDGGFAMDLDKADSMLKEQGLNASDFEEFTNSVKRISGASFGSR